MAADPGGAGSGVSGAATVGDVYCTSTADPEPAAALLHTLGLEDFKGSCRSCWSFNALGALEGPPGRTTLPLASWNCSPSSSSSIVTMRRLWSGYEETPVAWRPDQQQAPTYQVISCSRSHQARLGTMVYLEKSIDTLQMEGAESAVAMSYMGIVQVALTKQRKRSFVVIMNSGSTPSVAGIYSSHQRILLWLVLSLS